MYPILVGHRYYDKTATGHGNDCRLVFDVNNERFRGTTRTDTVNRHKLSTARAEAIVVMGTNVNDKQ